MAKKSATGYLFFHLCKKNFFFTKMDNIFMGKRKKVGGEKKIAAARLASILATRCTGNRIFLWTASWTLLLDSHQWACGYGAGPYLTLISQPVVVEQVLACCVHNSDLVTEDQTVLSYELHVYSWLKILKQVSVGNGVFALLFSGCLLRKFNALFCHRKQKI